MQVTNVLVIGVSMIVKDMEMKCQAENSIITELLTNKIMGYIKVYTPICQMKIGKKDSLGNYEYFTVNGATNQDKDEAIRLTNKHSAIRSKEAEIIRVDEAEVYQS